MDSKKKEACLGDGCKEAAIRRGLCNRHYMAAWRAIDLGETSWSELERLGIAKSAKVGRPSKFRQVIETARRKATGKK